MSDCRTYKNQFEQCTINKIEVIIDLTKELRKRDYFLSYYCNELCGCLKGGSIFGGLLIAFSILEMTLLDTHAIIMSRNRKEHQKGIHQIELAKTHIDILINRLQENNKISSKDAEYLKILYREYRIPLAHGLRTKGLYEYAGIQNFFSLVTDPRSASMPVMSRDMEDIIENSGLDIISDILNILLRVRSRLHE